MLVPASPDFDDKELKRLLNQWPENPKDLRLMGLIALSLGLREHWFYRYFKDSTSFIRLTHYLRCPFPNLALGIGRHKDGGALTVLYQDEVGGLEVKCKTDGE
ncbi:hypothetical protein AG4045_012295 [Apium graveolens]|uniref:Isopenicillin N synthase-like Fe(2+) 2OG dioxygenase domain-containing protein n=1 Tax=Apium graveolens TaxID=4045 RepID=A0A6L5BBQ3_APIGR|nr:hypothetical protein AG4045_012295 [Apium graveolens]